MDRGNTLPRVVGATSLDSLTSRAQSSEVTEEPKKDPVATEVPPDLLTLLEGCETLPRPPGIAFRLIQRTNDPDATAEQIAEVLASDPVLAGRIVGLANSPVYAQEGEVSRLDRAVTVIGFRTTMSTALSFSLLASLKAAESDDAIDCQLFWRSSLLTAVACRVFAKRTLSKEVEELFLTGLLQDIGILALSRSVPGFYAGLEDEQLNQDVLVARERKKFGADHGVVGAWLVEKWGFPEQIVSGVLGSHNAWSISSGSTLATFVHCTALSSMIAEVFLEHSSRRRFDALAEAGEKRLGLDQAALLDLFHEIAQAIPESERVFETPILSAPEVEDVLEAAVEALGSTVPTP